MTARPSPTAAEEEFARFVTQHGRALGRLAYLLVGDPQGAEDLTADVMLDAWRQWDRVAQADHPLAYVRKIMVNQAGAGFRRRFRERARLALLQSTATDSTHDPDSAAVVDVRSVLLRLPPGRRACLVLRFAFDLTEREVAAALGVSVGTVKSQTSKAVQQFRRELGDAFVDTRATTPSPSATAPSPAGRTPAPAARRASAAPGGRP